MGQLTLNGENLLKITIGVAGRFYSAHIGNAFLRAGHDVTLCTTLPRGRFEPFPGERITTFLPVEVIARLLEKIGAPYLGDSVRIRSFARGFGRLVGRNLPDVLVCWSSYAKEAFLAAPSAVKVLVRESAHIVFQDEILKREYSKFGVKQADRAFVTQRECFEYEKADYIVVSSKFIKATFLKHGVPESKIKIVSPGVNTSRFTPSPQPPPMRPFQLINWGYQSFRKGIYYLLEATKDYSPDELQLHLIGDIEPAMKGVLDRYSHAKIYPPMSHAKLSEFITKMHAFVLPSLEDGLSYASLEAMAAGLVPILTTNVGSAERVTDGKSGFIVPICDPDALRQAIEKLRTNPERWREMRAAVGSPGHKRTWLEFGDEFNSWIQSLASKEKIVSTARS